MNITPKIPKQCAFCAFKASPWSTSLFRWQNGSVRHRTKGPRPGSRERRRIRGASNGSSIPRSSNNAQYDSARASLDTQDVRRDPRDGFQMEVKRIPGVHRNSSLQPTDLKVHSKHSKESAYDILANLVYEQVRKFGVLEQRTLDHRMAKSPKEERQKALRILDQNMADFAKNVRASAARAARLRKVTLGDNPLFFHFRQAFITGHIYGLFAEIKYRYLNSVHGKTIPSFKATAEFQEQLADLSYPTEWYPSTRAMQRTIHLHIGPTNSGKTYHALKRLEAARTGVYAGPLRLLAHEVYTRFNAMGKTCALITGEEQRIPEGMTASMSSCTVEMVPLNSEVDVAVIDEIQMIGDIDRGWAWTQAFLGVMAKEVHLCGEERTEELITSLCQNTGDKLVIHRYSRLGALDVEPKSFNSKLKNLQKGDAVILFSRVAIHAMKKSIEEETGRRCAVVYGSLPPETRAQQAALFNDPNNDYDFLAASNAVGMGLNLSIKRIIFEGVSRFDGVSQARLDTSEIKQIAGRAGRYKSSHEAIQEGSIKHDIAYSSLPSRAEPSTGFVTSYHQEDLNVIQTAMRTTAPQIKTAGVFPPENVTSKFASFFPPETPFTYILLRMKELIKINPQHHMCAMREIIELLDLIQPYKMTVKDRLIFANAPVSIGEPGAAATICELASCISNQSSGELLDIGTLKLELLDKEVEKHKLGTKGYLREAELLHKGLTLYLWLSYRFPAVFRSQALAFHTKGLVEEKIDFCLSQVAGHSSRKVHRVKEKKLEWQEQTIKELEDSGLLGERDEGAKMDEEEKLDEDESIEHLEELTEEVSDKVEESWTYDGETGETDGEKSKQIPLADLERTTPVAPKIEAEA